MNKYIIEFLGTLFFIYVVLATGHPLAIGLALTAAIMIGGGTYNPVATIVMVAAGKLPMHNLIPHLVAQVAGGLAALQLHKWALRQL